MKTKKISNLILGVILLLNLILLSSFVSAELIQHFDFEDDLVDSVHGIDGANDGGAITFSNANPVNWGDGTPTNKLGIFDGGDCLDTNWGKQLKLPDDHSVCFWLDWDAEDYVLSSYTVGVRFHLYQVGGDWVWYVEDGNQWAEGYDRVSNANHYCWVRNGTTEEDIQLYVNGTATALVNSWGAGAINNNNYSYDLRLGCKYHTGVVSNQITGRFDEYMIFDHQLNATEANNTYWCGNYSTCGAAGGASQDTVNISNVKPITNSQFSATTINFNGTVISSGDYNCSLYINNTLIETTEYSSTDNYINFTRTLEEGNHTFYFYCEDNTTNETTSENIFYLDITPPTKEDAFLNNSVYFKDNITGQFNFSDDFILHSYNISIDGTQIAGRYGIGSPTAQYNLSYDPSTLSIGVHTLGLRWADGHTAEELGGDYDWNNGLFNDYMRYRFYDQGYIKSQLKDSSWFDTWKTERLRDRYIQILKPANPSSTITIVEESDMLIYIYNKPGYYGGYWIVMGNHWKDYLLKDEPNTKVSIKRITNYKVEVTISGIEHPERLEFNSIGDLNIVTKDYTFYTTNATLTYSEPVFETDQQTMTLEINTTGGSTTDAQLYWNGTLQTSTKTNHSNYDSYSAVFSTPKINNAQENITFYWLYDITLNGTETGNITNNQSVYRMSIDNCSTYSARAINFTLIDEETNIPINGTIHATIHTSRSDSTNYRSNSFDFNGANLYSICIYPSFANYNITSYSFEYLAEGYATEEYMFYNLRISNQTQLINLYLVNESVSENVVITLKDIDDNLLEDYTIRVKRFYPETGEEITTEITETDHNGNAVVHLVLNDVYYSFSIEKEGEVVKIIDPAKYYTTSHTFVIDISETILNFEDKVYYSTSPDSPVQSQPTNFSLTTISPGNYIEWFAIYTYFNGTDHLSNSSDTDGGTVQIEVDLTNVTGWLTITYYIKVEDEDLFSFTGGYFVTDITPGDYSIEKQKSEWEGVFSVMWRAIVAVLVSIFAVLVFVPFIGTEAAGIIGFLIQVGFLIIGWIPLWMGIVEGVMLIGLYLLSQRGAV